MHARTSSLISLSCLLADIGCSAQGACLQGLLLLEIAREAS